MTVMTSTKLPATGIFKDLGIIKEEKLLEVQRSDLLAQYIGATAQKTEKMIKKAESGVLFVDEAYRLCSNSEKNFGREAIETIMARMTPSDGEQTIFIFARYGKEMEEFDNINASLMRRIKTRLYFENFTTEALSHITKIKTMKGHVR